MAGECRYAGTECHHCKAQPGELRQHRHGPCPGSPPFHHSPPAKPGLTTGGRGPCLSIFLYHEISHAAPAMMAIPARLTRNWTGIRLETSVKTKCAAKDRNTPRQKMPSECWPHRMAGRKKADFSAGQSRGTSRSVTIASDRKCRTR